MEKNKIKKNDKVLDKKKTMTVSTVVAASVITLLVGYRLGYRKAQKTASGIVDCIAEVFDKPSDRKKFYDIWNYGVAKYFEKLKKN